VFVFVREINRRIEQGPLGEGDRERIFAALGRADQVFGVFDPAEWEEEPGEEDAELDRLVGERQSARQARDFQRADEIRDQLAARGIVIEDTPHGPRWKRA
jgi:cysteinyl-tRNA synthetase